MTNDMDDLIVLDSDSDHDDDVQFVAEVLHKPRNVEIKDEVIFKLDKCKINPKEKKKKQVKDEEEEEDQPKKEAMEIGAPGPSSLAPLPMMTTDEPGSLLVEPLSCSNNYREIHGSGDDYVELDYGTDELDDAEQQTSTACKPEAGEEDAINFAEMKELLNEDQPPEKSKSREKAKRSRSKRPPVHERLSLGGSSGKITKSPCTQKRRSDPHEGEKKALSRELGRRMAFLTSGGDEKTAKTVREFAEVLFIAGPYTVGMLRMIRRLADEPFKQEIQQLIMQCDLQALPEGLLAKVMDILQKQPGPEQPPTTLGPVPTREAKFKPFSFTRWADQTGTLTLKYERTLAEGVCRAPLGACYDGERFLFTGEGCLMSCSDSGEDVQVHLKNLIRPSALAVIGPGETVAFLEGNKIQLWYKHDNTVDTIVQKLHNHTRGLAYINGALITCEGGHDSIRISVYSACIANELLGAFPYGPGEPSFMSSSGHYLFITDLMQKTVRKFRVHMEKSHHHRSRCWIEEVAGQNLTAFQAQEKCRYPSGVATDSRGECIVADARFGGGWLLWSDSQLSSWKRVHIAAGLEFPYTSQIAISPAGYLLAACRQSHCCKLFRFVSPPPNDNL